MWLLNPTGSAILRHEKDKTSIIRCQRPHPGPKQELDLPTVNSRQHTDSLVGPDAKEGAQVSLRIIGKEKLHTQQQMKWIVSISNSCVLVGTSKSSSLLWQ